MLLKQWTKEKSDTLPRKKQEKYQCLMTSADGKGTVFPVMLKLEDESFE